MVDAARLPDEFEVVRPHLHSVALRMLGSAADADDAVQETWLRFSRADTSGVENLTGWLTTVVSRICLDALRTRRSRHEEPLTAAPGPAPDDRPGPEQEAVLGDTVAGALVVVLERLSPPERVAFVLHDLFGVGFEEIGRTVDRSPAAARQLASRARRRVRGADVGGLVQRERERQVVEAFLRAARHGDVDGMVALLAPDVVVRTDGAAAARDVPRRIDGAPAVASFFSGKAQSARTALLDGDVGAVVHQDGRALVLLRVSFDGGVIAAIDAIADPERLASAEVDVLAP